MSMLVGSQNQWQREHRGTLLLGSGACYPPPSKAYFNQALMDNKCVHSCDKLKIIRLGDMQLFCLKFSPLLLLKFS